MFIYVICVVLVIVLWFATELRLRYTYNKMSFEPDVSAPDLLCVICNEDAAIHYTSDITDDICPRQVMIKLFGADCLEREDLSKKIYEHVTLYRSQFLPDFTIHCVHRNKFDMFEILLSHDHESYGRVLDFFVTMLERKPKSRRPEYRRFYIALFKKLQGRFKPYVYSDLYWLVMASKISMTLFRWVAAQGLNVNDRNYLGETLLHLAISYNQFDLLKASLQLGVDPTICSYAGTSPFVASLYTRPRMSTLLAQYLVCEDEKSCAETWSQVLMADSLAAYDLVKTCKHINFKVKENGKPFNIIDKFLSSPARYRLSLFKAIWDRIDYEKAYADIKEKTVIQDVVFYSSRALYPILLTIIQSDKLPEVVSHARRTNAFQKFPVNCTHLKPTVLIGSTFTIGLMVVDLAHNSVSAYNVKKAVVPLLKAGIPLLHTDLEIILALYKYGDLFETVFAFGCKYRGRLGVTNNAWAQHVIHVANPLYWTKRQYYGWEKRTLRPYFALDKKVPSLREVARNASRKFICQHYNVLTALKYYEVLQSLELPKFVRDILMLKVPLYVI